MHQKVAESAFENYLYILGSEWNEECVFMKRVVLY
jgi:hypothetical protein